MPTIIYTLLSLLILFSENYIFKCIIRYFENKPSIDKNNITGIM